ncbi:putative polyketide synthase [Hypoxylon sp. FL1284]|nr:putative polyketide synthase [Hypoxylon sp. FL1284]
MSPSGAHGHGEARERENCEPIAVIGFSLKFPGIASSVEGFWKMLIEGRSTMSEFPSDRINIDGHFHPDHSRLDEINARGGHFIDEKLDRFDAPFFSITPAEAGCMDPQQRGILETAYRALENAGITIEQCSGTRTSVHTGSFTDDYRSILFQDPLDGHTYAASGLSSSMLANRVSWFFNLKGPSINMDTACSSSLTALHLSCEDLRNGTTDMGLAGGCNLLYHPDYMKIMSDMGFLSPDSRSWSLDEKANGYSRGEGIGIVVLKRLSDAVRDGDTVRAVIRASALSQDGRTPGITVPNGDAHKALIRETYAKAKLDMEPTRFFEAHATGTRAGDPVEANAIGETFGRIRSAADPLWVGAIKSNVGHLEAASGMAGLFKTILVLEKGIIPPNAGFETLNKRIQAKRYHLAIPTEPCPWPVRGLRRACINSFGFGGSNAVVVLDDAHHFALSNDLSIHHRTAPEPPSDREARGITEAKYVNGIQNAFKWGSSVFVWSSFDEGGLKRIQTELSTFFDRHMDDLNQEDVRDILYTLGVKRTQFSWRSYVVPSSLSDLRKKLTQALPRVKSAPGRGAAFIFTGQGAQYAGMGQGFMVFPVFRESMESSQKLLNSMGCEWDLLDIMFSAGHDDRINEPQYSQPTCTALQIALIGLLAVFNIRPTAVVGHSSGEIAAAYCIGALSQEDGLKIAFHRGRLAAKMHTGSTHKLTMMAAGIGLQEAREYIDKLNEHFDSVLIDVACINSNKNVTLSGDETQLSFLEKRIQGDNKFARKLRVNTAYHSRFMESIAEEYRACLRDLSKTMALPQPCPVMVSSVTGDFINPPELKGAEYWVKNMTSAVRFFDATSKLVTQSRRQRKVLGGIKQTVKVSDMLEIGPHHALLGPVRETLQSMGLENTIPYHSTLVRNSSSAENDLRHTAGKLFSLGYAIDIAAANSFPNSPRTVRTDLPEYPFNHSQSHWRESRIGRNYRLRDTPRHDLLGIKSSDWNPLQPQWRNLVSEDRLPWLRDHQIAGEFLYPAGGMIAMAIEAAKELATPREAASSYELRDVQFLNPFRTFHQDDPIETQFSLMPLAQNPRWSEFHLFVYDDRGCTEICRGRIQTHYDQEDNGVSKHLQRWSVPAFLEGLGKNRQTFKSQALYERFVKVYGAQYGPTFQTLENVSISATGQVTAELNINKWTEAHGDGYVSPYVVHPCTMDGLFQSGFPMAEPNESKQSFVPTRIRRLWVNARALSSFPGNTVQVMTECSSRGYRGTDVLSRVVSPNTNEPLIEMEHYETTMISSSSDSASEVDTPERNLCATVRWLPDIALLTPKQVQGLVRSPADSVDETEETKQFYQDLHIMLRFFISDALVRLESQDEISNHGQYLVKWMKYQMRTGAFGLRDNEKKWLQDETYRKDKTEYIRNYSPEGKVLTVLGETAYGIIRGEIDPIQILFESTLASDCYRQILSEGPYIPSLTNMRILEIGAGTGGCTQPVTLALQEQGHPLWSQYDFTDISPGFFSEAQETFSEFSHCMKFRVFDAMANPLEQGFEEASYDLIVAGNVLHALKGLKTTLCSIRRLLKPGGKLVLFEITNPDAIRAGLYGGVLKDWWNTIRDTKRYTPLLSVESWHAILLETGFTGLDTVLKDHEDPDIFEQSILISSASFEPVEPLLENRAVNILANYAVPAQKELGDSLRDELASRGVTCKCTNIESLTAEDATETTCVSLLEVGKPFLATMREDDFHSLKRLIINCKGILWVTQDDNIPASPEYSLIDGLGRVLRAEYPNHKLVKLSLEPRATRDSENRRKNILGVLDRMLASDIQDTESEYSERDGILNINRVVHSNDMNKMIASRSKQRHTVDARLQDAPPLELRVDSPGLLDSVRFHQINESSQPLGETEVLIRAHAIGLGPREYQIASGHLNEKEFGMQCAGVVEEAGSASGFSAGDRVCTVKLSASQTMMRASVSEVAKIPDFVSYTDAASLPAAAMLAVHCLTKIAHLQGGETVLIQDAASTAGQVMIQVAQSKEARIFVTAKSAGQRDMLHQKFNIPKERIFSNIDASARDVILDATDDQGVDVAILTNDDEDMETCWSCLAYLGRIVRLNPKDSIAPRSLQGNTNVSVSHVNFADILRGRRKYVKQLLSEACAMIRDQQIRPLVDVGVYKPDEFESALQSFRREEGAADVVIELVPDSILTMTIAPKPLYTFDEDSTYVIAGGLGGLGRSITRWMVERGARHVLLLSRSGTTKPSGRELVEELSQRGVQVLAPSCDVADLDQLEKAVGEASRTMPPIRGCIQGTMVLRDSVIDNMSWDDWTESTRPKVQGSWNLHTTMPKGMDFFLFLSSVSGIVGGLSQANYASGNTYEDALCHYRNSIGEQASSVNLGVLVAEGVVAETDGLLLSLRGLGHFMEVSQSEMFALLEHHCHRRDGVASEERQTVFGIQQPSFFLNSGRDLPTHLARPFFRHFHCMEASKDHDLPTRQDQEDYSSIISKADSLEDVEAHMTRWLVIKLSRVLGLVENDIDTSRPISSYGVDSLLGLEMRNWFEKTLGSDIPIFELLNNSSMAEVCRKAASRTKFRANGQESS